MLTPEDVKNLREGLGESQETFGSRFGVTQTAVSLWETKGPPSRGLVRAKLDELRSATPSKEVAA
jgi:DNA-binding transcriptional regulator YiaG